MIRKIISGGQTGVDRAAMDFALEYSIQIGGWVPRGRWAEDGRLPTRYPNLNETLTDQPDERTRLNVQDSDGTLIICRGNPAGGTLHTIKFALAANKPLLIADLAGSIDGSLITRLKQWLSENDIQALNVAGPRASEDPEICLIARQFLRRLYAAF